MGSHSSKIVVPVANEGIPFIGLAVVFTLTMALLGWALLSLSGLVLTAFVTYFFRDPHRIVPSEPDCIISPADGRIVSIEIGQMPPCFVNVPMMKISIFMSLFDVHVNRAPERGTIKEIRYFRGRFVAAQKDRASMENERSCILIETSRKDHIIMVQVAGLIARRIVCWSAVGDMVERGERIGMIRFGSRVDLYVPSNWEVLVSHGDMVRAGEDILCKVK